MYVDYCPLATITHNGHDYYLLLLALTWFFMISLQATNYKNFIGAIRKAILPKSTPNNPDCGVDAHPGLGSLSTEGRSAAVLQRLWQKM